MIFSDRILRFLFSWEIKKYKSAKERLGDNDRYLHATAMLDNPIFMEALKSMEDELVSMWKDTPFSDSKVREDIHLAVQALRGIKLKLESYANKIRFDELIKERQRQYREMVV